MWDARTLTKMFQHCHVQALPDSCSLPLSQTSPTRHAAAVAKRLRQVLPRNTCLQNIKNSLECILIADRAIGLLTGDALALSDTSRIELGAADQAEVLVFDLAA